MERHALLRTSTKRPKLEQPQELQPNRSHTFALRGATAVLFLVLLGGCSTTIKECLASDTTRLLTSGTESQIPQGCVATETAPNGLALLDCDGGREGFMVLAKPN